MNKNELEIAGCLRRLLKSRFLLRSRNEKWFQTIVDLRLSLQKIFESMAMNLEINESLGLAFLKPIDEEIEEAVAFQMGRRQTLSPLASALLYKLRHQRLQFYLNPANDLAPLVTTGEMREFLQNFNSTKIDSQFERSFRAVLKELENLQIIYETKPDSEIFEISPICEILLPLDQIQEMAAKIEAYFSARSTEESPTENSGGQDAR